MGDDFPDRDDTTIYRAIINSEEQYSIWPVDRELPLGWTDAGKVGLKYEVLEWIREVWTYIPISVRKRLAPSEDRTPVPAEHYMEILYYRAVKRPDGLYILLPPFDHSFRSELFVSQGWVDKNLIGTEEELESMIKQLGGAIAQKYRQA